MFLSITKKNRNRFSSLGCNSNELFAVRVTFRNMIVKKPRKRMKIAVISFPIAMIIGFYCNFIRGTMIIIIFIFINEKRNSWNK